MKSALCGWRQIMPAQLALAVVHSQGRIKVRMFGAWLRQARFERDSVANFRADATRRLVTAAFNGWRQHTQHKVAVVAAHEAHMSRRRLHSCLEAWREYQAAKHVMHRRAAVMQQQYSTGR